MTEVQLSHDNSPNNNNMWSVTGYCDLANGHLMLGLYIIKKSKIWTNFHFWQFYQPLICQLNVSVFWGFTFSILKILNLKRFVKISYFNLFPLRMWSEPRVCESPETKAAVIFLGELARPPGAPGLRWRGEDHQWSGGQTWGLALAGGDRLQLNKQFSTLRIIWLKVYGRNIYGGDLLSSRDMWNMFGEFSQIYVTPEPVMINDTISPMIYQ